jgi:3'-5' exoribonuclease
MKDQYINDLKQGEKVNTEFVIRNKIERTKKNGAKYCLLVLQDRTGAIDGVIWNDSIIDFDKIRDGDFVRVTDSVVSEYRSRKQIEISAIIKINNDSVERSDFEKVTKKNIEKMMSGLKHFINSVNNIYLNKILEMFFEDDNFVNEFCNSTAAIQYHHASRGGLLEHTLSVVKICDWLSGHYKNLNRDLLVTGAIFHDVGKIREYELSIPIKFTDEGKLLGHITIGYGMVLEKILKIKGFPADLRDNLLHIILSHHGHKEFGSPRRPKTPEAFIVYHADYMDAEIGGFNELLDENSGSAEWSEYLRNFERSLFLKRPELYEVIDGELNIIEDDPSDQDKLF